MPLLDPKGKNVLLLQGPNGPFFARLGQEFKEQGAKVTKVNFNGGDSFFYPGPDAIGFRSPMDKWPEFLSRLCDEKNIDVIYLFGGCRPQHSDAKVVAKKAGIPVWVFEEGYVRPDHITCELGGVNGNSPMPKTADYFLKTAARIPRLLPVHTVRRTFGACAWYTTFYAIAATLLSWRYPHYKHHRNINFLKQMCIQIWGAVRKYVYLSRQAPILDLAKSDWSGNYDLVPLQVHCDSQLSHSSYGSIEEFIENTVASFAKHSPPSQRLILKHHPRDRAYRNYTTFIESLATQYELGNRLVYVHDLDLDTLLSHARCTITMNSTVGIASLQKGTPVKVMGRSVYDIPGLTFQGPLEEFLEKPGRVDLELCDAFIKTLLGTNQLNGSFHRRMPGIETPTGVGARVPALSEGHQEEIGDYQPASTRSAV